MTTLTYLPSFEADALDIWLYVAQDNPSAADRLVDRLYKRCEILRAHPNAGPLRPDIAMDCRQLVETPMLVLYRVVGDEVQLVRALYQGRNLNPDLFVRFDPRDPSE